MQNTGTSYNKENLKTWFAITPFNLNFIISLPIFADNSSE